MPVGTHCAFGRQRNTFETSTRTHGSLGMELRIADDTFVLYACSRYLYGNSFPLLERRNSRCNVRIRGRIYSRNSLRFQRHYQTRNVHNLRLRFVGSDYILRNTGKKVAHQRIQKAFSRMMYRNTAVRAVYKRTFSVICVSASL